MKFKKILLMMMLCIAVAFTTSGCKSDAKDKEDNTKQDAFEEKEEDSEKKADKDSEKKEDTDSNDKEEENDTQEALSEEEQELLAKAKYDFSGSLNSDEANSNKADSKEENAFALFTGMEFYFSSGVGGWGTNLVIEEDGSFHGTYSDSDMGTTGAGYPNGTVYMCNYYGKFGPVSKVDEYRYKTTIDKMVYEEEVNKEEIIDEIRYVYTEAYGIEGAKDIYLCLPNMPTDYLTEDEKIWLMYSIDNDLTTCHAVVNHAMEEAFAGYKNDYESDEPEEDETYDTGDGRSSLEIDLENLEEKSYDLIFELNNSNYSQMELNLKSYELYKLWDDKLNELYKMAKELEIFDSIQKEQRIWLEYKEKRVKNAGMEFEGGSMQSYVENMEGYKLTKQRVFELAEYVW